MKLRMMIVCISMMMMMMMMEDHLCHYCYSQVQEVVTLLVVPIQMHRKVQLLIFKMQNRQQIIHMAWEVNLMMMMMMKWIMIMIQVIHFPC